MVGILRFGLFLALIGFTLAQDTPTHIIKFKHSVSTEKGILHEFFFILFYGALIPLQ
jgi:hypothetical protein